MSVTWNGTIDLTAWCFLSQPALLHGGWAQLLSYCLVPRLCLIFCLLSKLYSKKLVYLTFYQTWSLTVIWSQRTRVSWCVNVSKKCTLKVLRIKAWKKNQLHVALITWSRVHCPEMPQESSSQSVSCFVLSSTAREAQCLQIPSCPRRSPFLFYMWTSFSSLCEW